MKAIVSEKGQVTIPKKLRDKLGIKAGEVLEFKAENGQLVAVKTLRADPVEAVCGILPSRKTTNEWLNELRGPVDAL